MQRPTRKRQRCKIPMFLKFALLVCTVYLCWSFRRKTKRKSNIVEVTENNNNNPSSKVVENEPSMPHNDILMVASLRDNINLKDNGSLPFLGKEAMFLSVGSKSCLDSTNNRKPLKCLKEFVNQVQRIGILSPPHPVSDAFAKWIQQKIISNTNDDDSIQVEISTHVPPYGYGGNHGWTQIIRFIHTPIAFNMPLYPNGSDTTNDKSATQIFRQWVRWHCRLSHVSAHTSMLTIVLPTVVDSASLDTIYRDQIQPFIAPSSSDSTTTKQDTSKESTSAKEAENNYLEAYSSWGKQFVWTDKKQYKLIQNKFGPLLRNELEKSDNLKKWPCTSFWDSYNPLTPKAKEFAQHLIPQCSNSTYSKCSVPRDFCEESGKAKCKN